MHIGRKIKKFRDENKISQTEFAEKIGVTQGFLSYVENGRLNIESPSLEKKILIAIGEAPDADLKKDFEKNVELASDNVHSPKHYMIPGCNFECKDLSDAIVRNMPNPLGTRIWNVVKYLVRAEKKNGLEDYNKAVEYLSWIEKGNEADEYDNENTLDSIANKLDTDWTTIIFGICGEMPTKKALLMNETFRNIIALKIPDAINCVNKIIELG
jgi:hypothetical protein